MPQERHSCKLNATNYVFKTVFPPCHIAWHNWHVCLQTSTKHVFFAKEYIYDVVEFHLQDRFVVPMQPVLSNGATDVLRISMTLLSRQLQFVLEIFRIHSKDVVRCRNIQNGVAVDEGKHWTESWINMVSALNFIITGTVSNTWTTESWRW
jgi:hypothetical protein